MSMTKYANAGPNKAALAALIDEPVQSAPKAEMRAEPPSAPSLWHFTTEVSGGVLHGVAMARTEHEARGTLGADDPVWKGDRAVLVRNFPNKTFFFERKPVVEPLGISPVAQVYEAQRNLMQAIADNAALASRPYSVGRNQLNPLPQQAFGGGRQVGKNILAALDRSAYREMVAGGPAIEPVETIKGDVSA